MIVTLVVYVAADIRDSAQRMKIEEFEKELR